MAWDPLASVGRMLTMWGVLARGIDCTDGHLACLTAGVQQAGLDVHDISLANGSADVLGYEVSTGISYGGGRAIGYHVFAQSHVRSLRAVA